LGQAVDALMLTCVAVSNAAIGGNLFGRWLGP